MTTANANRVTGRLTLDRSQRDALHRAAQYMLEGHFADMCTTFDTIRDRADEIRAFIALFDALGWDDEGDQPSYVVEIDTGVLGSAVADRRADIVKSIEYERACLAKARAGDVNWMIEDDLSETESQSASLTAEYLADLASIDRLLALLEA